MNPILVSHSVLFSLLVGAVVLVILVAVALRLWTGKHSRRARYTQELPTWGGNYRNALATRARKPARMKRGNNGSGSRGWERDLPDQS